MKSGIGSDFSISSYHFAYDASERRLLCVYFGSSVAADSANIHSFLIPSLTTNYFVPQTILSCINYDMQPIRPCSSTPNVLAALSRVAWPMSAG
jgi:hypothetical protein